MIRIISSCIAILIDFFMLCFFRVIIRGIFCDGIFVLMFFWHWIRVIAVMLRLIAWK